MGSSQSTPESFSVDPSGKITSISASSNDNSRRNQLDSNQDISGDGRNAKTRDASDQSTRPSSTDIDNPYQKDYSFQTERYSSKGDEMMSLEDAENFAVDLKSKYKIKSSDNKSLFEQAEGKLINCYISNRSQPIKCSKEVDEYKNFVGIKRRELLSKAAHQNVPLITTILVIATCILLHLSTVSCYGAMSIDLGSEWMKVGLVASSVQMDIVLNPQSQRKTAMAVAFSKGERFVGDPALDLASKYPERCFTHFLDLVAKSIEDESVKHYQKRFPYANLTSHEPNSTSIILNHPEGLNFTPLELIAMMIQHAHDQVVDRLKSNEPATDVVITVPPFFNDKERRVIKDAAELAGLNLLRLTNVNSAFALSYGIFRHKDYVPEILLDSPLDNTSNNRTSILFFDQGASHTSITLADYHLVENFERSGGKITNISVPTISIRAQVFDRFLGGFDMQLKLSDHLISAFAKKNNIDKSKIYNRGKSLYKILKEAGKVKKILSANNDHLVRIENVIDDQDMRHQVSRTEYEEMNSEYLGGRITKLLDSLFEMPNLSRENEKLESVIIVGGNTRTPKIQQVLQDYFKLETLGKSINADEGAALSTLYQAASMGRGFRVKRFDLEEFGHVRKPPPPQPEVFVPEPVVPKVESKEVNGTTNSSETPADESNTKTADEIRIEQVQDDLEKKEREIQRQKEELDRTYSDAELKRIGKKLGLLREEDFMRMQLLSWRNSLESLLSRTREILSEDSKEEQVKVKEEEIQKLVDETNHWLDFGPYEERNNLTVLQSKYSAIHQLVFPKPPPPPPPPPPAPPSSSPAAEEANSEQPSEFKFDPLNLSDVLKNGTRNILDRLKLVNPNLFSLGGDSSADVDHAEQKEQDESKDDQGSWSESEASHLNESVTPSATPADNVGPRHTEL